MEEKKELYPEEEMMIEQEALKAFLNIADYEETGIRHFQSYFESLAKRLLEYENE